MGREETPYLVIIIIIIIIVIIIIIIIISLLNKGGQEYAEQIITHGKRAKTIKSYCNYG